MEVEMEVRVEMVVREVKVEVVQHNHDKSIHSRQRRHKSDPSSSPVHLPLEDKHPLGLSM